MDAPSRWPRKCPAYAATATMASAITGRHDECEIVVDSDGAIAIPT
jgi:hypothetical protein